MRQPHEDAKVRARALGLARQGTVPPALRGVVWVRGINNSLQVTQTLYETCVARAETTQAALAKEREAEASGAIDIDPDTYTSTDVSDNTSKNNSNGSTTASLTAYLGYGEDLGPALPMRGFEIDPKFITAGPLPSMDTEEEKEAGKMIMSLLLRKKTHKKESSKTVNRNSVVQQDIQTLSVTEALQRKNIKSPSTGDTTKINRKQTLNTKNQSLVATTTNNEMDDDNDEEELNEFKDVSSPLRSSNNTKASSSNVNEKVGFSPSVKASINNINNYDDDDVIDSDSETESPLDSSETVILRSARQRNLFAPKTLNSNNNDKKNTKNNKTIRTVTTTTTTTASKVTSPPDISPSLLSSSSVTTEPISSTTSSATASLSSNPVISAVSSGSDTVTSSVLASTDSSSIVPTSTALAPSSGGVFSFLTTALWWSNQGKKKDISVETNDTTTAAPDSLPIVTSPPKPKILRAATSFVSRDGSILRSSVPLHGYEGSIDAVEMDLDRIFPEYRAFFAPGSYARHQLIRVLSAYAFFRPDHGYIQGMSHIAAVLILTVGSLAPSAEDLRLIERSRKSKVTTAQEADVFSWQSSALARARGAAKETNAAILAADNDDGKLSSEDTSSSSSSVVVSSSSSSWFTFFGAPAPAPVPSDTDNTTAVVSDVHVPSGNSKKKVTASSTPLTEEESIALALPPLPSEVIVFICFTNLMGRAPLRWLASRDTVRMDIWYELYTTVLTRTCPKLAKFLDDSGIKPNLYLVSWLLTLFAKPLGLEASTRLWDVCLIGGHAEILKCAVGLTKFLENRLLYRSFERVMRTLGTIPSEYQNPYGVLEAAESVKLIPSDLAKLATMDMM